MAGQHFSGYHATDHGSDNPIFAFFYTVSSWNPTILRLILGLVFLYHGGQKAFGWFDGDGWEATMKAFTQMGFPVYLAAAGILAEVAGAFGLLLGFFTRVFALAIFTVMMVAIIFVNWEKGIAGIEYNIVLAGVAVALVFSGGGNFSMDKELSKQLLP